MRHSHRLAAIAVSATLALPSLGVAPASATRDFVEAANPAVSYKFGAFERRGVLMPANGVLTVRDDGCWRSTVEVMNASGRERTVSVVMRVSDRRGRPLADLVVVDGDSLAAAEGLVTTAQGCDGALAQGFPPRPHTVKRVFSVH